MKTIVQITLLTLLISLIVSPVQVCAADTNQGLLSLSVQTDQGYYAPGDTIRIRGTITTEDTIPVNTSLQFMFQGMNRTEYSEDDGSFLVYIPSSRGEPEGLYKLEITAHATGFREKNLSIPVVIMGEPSSLAPARVIPDEFAHT